MSEIKNLGQQVSRMVEDSNKTVESLTLLRKRIKKTQESIYLLMHGTSQSSYRDTIEHLSAAEKKLGSASGFLTKASSIGTEWLAMQVSGGTSGSSMPGPGNAAFPESQNTDPGDSVVPGSQNTDSGNSAVPGSQNTDSGGQFVRPDRGAASTQYSSAAHAFEKAGVNYNELHSFGRERTDKEIINRLGGGDRTEGSCSSLAFAYIGNRAGYDVLDFRDGNSRKLFSKRRIVEKISNLPGVDSQIISGRNEVACANRLLNTMLPGREYYLATGCHAVIARVAGDHFEYLELQHPTRNGWHVLDDYELLERFGCERSQLFESDNYLIDASTLRGNEEFLDLLGYLNTLEGEQNKGVNGYVK